MTPHRRIVAQGKGVFFAVALTLVGPSHALPPDAGQTIQSIEAPRPTLPKPSVPAVEIQQPRPVAAPDSGIKIPVTRFSITGSSIYTEDELHALVQDSVGKQLTLAEIEALAARITQHYRTNGYLLAQAYLPVQDIQNGKVEIAVMEGKYGNIDISNAGVLSSVPVTVNPGEVVTLDSLERNLLLLSDTPGVEVKSTLRPGASVGTVIPPQVSGDEK